MLSIAIYSNNETTTTDLKFLIQDFLIETKTMAKVSAFQKGEDVIEFPAKYDIYLIDMDTDEDSLSLGSQLMNIDDNGYFVLFSQEPANAYRATKIHAHYFLDKPFNKEEVFKVLTKIRKRVREDSIIIKTPLGERRVRVHNVNYINIVKRCLCYHLQDGTMFDGQTLRSSFEKAIGPLQEHESFVFVSPSLLINLSEIKIMDADHLIFENDDVLFFPKKAYDLIHDRWVNYAKIH